MPQVACKRPIDAPNKNPMADSAQVNVIANIKGKATDCQTLLVGGDGSIFGAQFGRFIQTVRLYGIAGPAPHALLQTRHSRTLP